MKEELLWGLPSSHCYLAVSFSLASSRVIPEISKQLLCQGSFRPHNHSCKIRCFFYFQVSHIHSRLRNCCYSPFAFILSHAFIYISQSLVSPDPLLQELCSTGCLSPWGPASCLDTARNELSWCLEVLLPRTPPKCTRTQECNQTHLEENFWRAQRIEWHFSYLDTNIFLA